MTQRTTLKGLIAASLLAVSTLSNALSPLPDAVVDSGWQRPIFCHISDHIDCSEFRRPRDVCDRWILERCPFPKPWIHVR